MTSRRDRLGKGGPAADRSKIKDLVARMLERDIIRPLRSPWTSPVVLVAKKDGSTHFCVDYCKLNAMTKPDVFPHCHARIDDCLFFFFFKRNNIVVPNSLKLV